jgi:myo-inositol-1(or 4)-monophosphatase
MNEMQTALKAAEEAGKIILHYYEAGVSVKHKNPVELLTQADVETEKKIREIISTDFPNHGILGEEQGGSTDSEFLWIIDPIDGTTNFVHHLPFFCTSIALVKNKEPVLGLVFNPVSKEIFCAEKGKGAFWNNKKISVSKNSFLKDSLVATGFPYERGELADRTIESLSKIVHKCRGIRRLGSAALDCCYVAKGSFEIYYEYSIKPWDIAAGCLIVQEAGGQLHSMDGSDFDLFSGNIVAGNGLVDKEFFEEIK